MLPELVPGTTWPYVALGTAYGVLALALMGAAAIRHARVRDSLRRGDFHELSDAWLLGFTAAGVVLTVATIVLVAAG